MTPKVMLGIPIYQNMRSQAWLPITHSIIRAVQQQLLVGISNPTDMYITLARNQICREAIEADCSHVWFVDDDTTPTSCALEILLQASKEVIGGSYNNDLDKPVAYKSLDPLEHVEFKPVAEPVAVGPVRVAAIGMGCTLISVAILKLMAHEFGDQNWFQTPYIRGTMTGDDVFFCERCDHLDIPIFLHPAVTAQHVKTKIVEPSSGTIVSW